MKIRRLICENYRGILGEVDFELAERLNVFYGENGAGKSTVLDAIATLLSWIVNRIRTTNATGTHIPEPDIHNEATHALLAFNGDYDRDRHHFAYHIAKARRGFSANGERQVRNLKEFVESLRSLIASGEGGLPLLAYYPVNRAVLDVPIRIRTRHDFGMLETYDQSLTRAANFRLFFEWFREREDIENADYRRKNRKNGFVPDPQLNAVKNALECFMPGFTDWTVCRKPLQMEVKKGGKTLQVTQLSVGEKCLMAMVGDIARRLAIANPRLENPLHGDGVVLIDEIDLHLHPAWQRMVVRRLLDTFPNFQFFISTHSPQVIGEVFADSHGQRIFQLRQTEEGVHYSIPKQAYGLDSNLILDGMMTSGKQSLSQNEDTANKLHEISQLIDREKFAAARKQIQELETLVGGTLPDTVEAAALIHMLDNSDTEGM